MPERPKSIADSVAGWWPTVERLRDLLLVVGTVLYIGGYLARSIAAQLFTSASWPALDSQYFVSGVPPLLILGIFLVTVTVIQKAKKRMHSFVLNNDMHPAARLLRGIAILWVAVAVASLAYRPFDSGARFLLQLFQFGALLVIDLAAPGVPNVRALGAIYEVIVPLLYTILVLWLIVVLLRFMPQELGGIQPRCAQLDLLAAELNPALVQRLGAPDAASAGAPIVRSMKLDLLYSGSATVIVSLPTSQSSLARREAIEIDRSFVRAIVWCGQ